MTHPRRPFSTSPALPGRSSRTSIPSVHGASPAILLGHPASVTVTAAAILFHLRLPVLLPMSTTYRSLAGLPSFPPGRSTNSATSCLLDQRPGDGTTRKAGFKIIMARAILITVARTATISGWHHRRCCCCCYHYQYYYYHFNQRRAATQPPTTMTARYALSLPSPFDISLRVSRILG